MSANWIGVIMVGSEICFAWFFHTGYVCEWR